VVSATTGDVEGFKQACVKGTSARFSRAKRAYAFSSKSTPRNSYTVVPFSDRSRTLLLLYATRTYT